MRLAVLENAYQLPHRVSTETASAVALLGSPLVLTKIVVVKCANLPFMITDAEAESKKTLETYT